MKKMKTYSLMAVALFALVGCSSNSTKPSSTEDNASSSQQAAYPDVVLNAKAYTKQLEVNQEVQVVALISAAQDVSKKCTFLSSDPSIAEITEMDSNGIHATVKGLKPGEVTITITSTANPNKSSSVKLEVIAQRPSLRQAMKNIQDLDNYCLTIGEMEDGSISKITAMEYVTEDTILYTSQYGSALSYDGNAGIFGEKVTSDGDVVYLKGVGTSYETKAAELVQSDAGLLTKDNFKGLKGETKQPFEVGDFYSFDAINPDWLTDEKAENNEYIIQGEKVDETSKPIAMTSAFVEAQMWKLADPSGYQSAVDEMGEDYYFTLAGKVTTTFYVETSDSVIVDVEVNDKIYRIEMSDMNNTDIEDAPFNSAEKFKNVKAAAPIINNDLEAGIKAIKTNNYVQDNSLFPDHKTQTNYNTYFTEDYVFYDCNKEFRDKYNLHLGSDAEVWEEVPNGYVKKKDGIYSFTYDETNDAVVVSDTKEANTDASTSLPKHLKYFSTIACLSNDLKYSFANEQKAIWSNHTIEYFCSTSRTVYDEFINYYSPEDISDVIENTKAGIGVKKDVSGKVTAVNATLGYTPYLKGDDDATKHTYGVNYFTMSAFGQANDNKVDSLLKAYIGK